MAAPVIRRLLVANRGEIALRVMRACRELDIETVAVYSDADAGAAHVAAADRAVRIGPPPAVESYLSIAAIVDAARQSGADAVHPGYGFLSENAGFSRACEEAGLVFVGPPSEVVTRMGSKTGARRLMEDAGVPVVPGSITADQSDAALVEAIDRIGYPALVKAAAGGGGKGMREVRARAEAEPAIQSARREAASAFGNGTLYVERRIERPHHVEVQIVADTHGGVVHVFERECSVQRRHQKVIEESPSPNVTPALRERLTQAAVRAARAAGYVNAGTVECLVDLAGASGDVAPFYFLEMNTRLQVEHGVTELVAGVDLVHAQLAVASGQPLPWTQDQLTMRGHAIEARVYAEDPATQFLPQAGRLLLYREPRLPGVRIDSGVVEGDEISVHYDPLLAKVIAHAETREQAIARLRAALEQFPILGVRTNIPFILGILAHESFQRGEIDTGFLDRHDAASFVPSGDAVEPFVRAAIAAAGSRSDSGFSQPPADAGPWQQLKGWRL